jgi:putative endonuclease
MHYLYVLRSVSDDGFYIGYSADLRARFTQHAQGCSFATSNRGPWKLIYYEAYLEQADALGRERYLKSGSGRKFLKTQLRNYLAKHHSETTASAKSHERQRAFTRIRTCSTGRVSV